MKEKVKEIASIYTQKAKDIAKKHKGYLMFQLITFCILCAGVIFVFNDYKFYDDTIGKVVKVQNMNGDSESEDQSQKLNIIIKNGKYKGESILVDNKYTYSRVFDNKYVKGNEVFLSISHSDSGKLTGRITGLKRDKYIALLVAVFIMLHIFLLGKKGVLSVIATGINIAICIFAFHMFFKGYDLFLLSNIMMIIFTVLSLTLGNGINKKTFAAIVGTLLSVTVTMVIFRLALKFGGEVDYAFMEYSVNPDDLHSIFMSEILIGGLGAIMDVSISMAIAIDELIEKDRNVSIKTLISSGREIGYDIMGTMINVLFFTYMSGCIPIILLKMKNDFSIFTILKLHLPFEIYRFLCGSIGIILSIPIALFVSIVFLKKRGKKA